jgi:hypothetical protein
MEVQQEERNPFRNAIDRALARPTGQTVENIKEEMSEVVANAAAIFMLKYVDDEKVTRDFEEFLRAIGVMKRQ